MDATAFAHKVFGQSQELRKVDPLKLKKKGALVVFVLDESGSMAGNAILNLNIAVNRFASEIIKRDSSLADSAEMAVIAFSTEPHKVLDWTQLGAFCSGAVNLSASGGTCIGSALDMAFDLLAGKQQTISTDDYSSMISYIVLISDGHGGSVDSQAVRISELTRKGGFKFWMLGVPGYDKPSASKLTAAGPDRFYELKDGNRFDFSPFFNELIDGIINGSSDGGGGSLPTVKPQPMRRL